MQLINYVFSKIQDLICKTNINESIIKLYENLALFTQIIKVHLLANKQNDNKKCYESL